MDSISLLEKMVSIYSPCSHEQKIVDFLVAESKKLGFDAHKDDAGNYICELGGKGKTLMLIGHIDTVPGEIPIRKEGGKLFGRGSVDAKGPMAAFISASFQSSGIRIILVGSVEEEGASSKGARFIVDKYKPDFVIIGEPSGWDSISIGYKGRILLDYTLEKPKRHSAIRGNVITEAIDFWSAINIFSQDYQADNEFDSLITDIRSISSSDDGFMQKAELKIGFRLPLGFDVKSLIDFVQKNKGDAKIEFSGYEKPIKTGKNNPLIKAFLKAIRTNDGEPSFKVKTGTCDMNILGHAWNVPILAYGPGDSMLDHTPEEHIILNEYLKSIEILKSVIQSLERDA